jgi:DNA-binding MarR family transcriptional regulator
MSADRARKAAGSTGAEWFTSDELKTWRAIHGVVAALPAVLGGQLRRDVDLSFLEYYVLVCLSEQPDHTLRMSRLAVLANSELSRLSHLVRRLENRSLLRRTPDPADGRFTLAVLTKEGRALVAEAAPAHVEHVRHLIFDVLDKKEQRAVRKASAKILSKLAEDT